MKGAIAKAMPAASAAFRASWSRGHSERRRDAAGCAMGPYAQPGGRLCRVVSSEVAIPAHPRAAWLLLQMDEPGAAPQEPAGDRSGRGAGGLPHCRGQPVGPAVGAAFFAAARHVAESDPVAGISEAEGRVGALVPEGQVAAEVPARVAVS